MQKFLRYQDYLQLTSLLELQKPRTSPAEHDEYLFITIHQVYELWFKQLIRELDHANLNIKQGKTHKAQHTLMRMLKILKTMVGQIDILETMTPIEFTSFRSFLDNASGFQSHQFREFEIMLGIRDEKKWHQFKDEPRIYKHLLQRADEPSVWDHVLVHLQLEKEDHEKQFKTLIEIYQNNDVLRAFLEHLVDLDEGLQEWRYRHVKMVERTIGHKIGTGGSQGAAYLQTTLFKPVFPLLWDIRDQL